MQHGFFITGTDTDIGKTWVTVALLRKFKQQGFKVAGMKPVAAGCEWRDGQLVNADALLLLDNSLSGLKYVQVNPYAFAAPVSPHLAAVGVEVKLDDIQSAFDFLKQQTDVVLVEGAGGWLSPLSSEFDNAYLAIALKLPVIIVVGMRLGCINQARLTYAAVKQAGVICAGWVAVEIAPGRPDFQGNLDYLQNCLEVPLLGVMPNLPIANFDFFAAQFVNF